MFNKLKNMLGMSSNTFNYVVDSKTFEDFLNTELQKSINTGEDLSVHLNVYFRGMKYNMYIWNYTSSDFKHTQAKGISVNFDKDEYHTIENMMNNAMMDGIRLIDITDYFEVELLDMDSSFLQNFKMQHPELIPGDYRE